MEQPKLKSCNTALKIEQTTIENYVKTPPQTTTAVTLNDKELFIYTKNTTHILQIIGLSKTNSEAKER